MILVTGSAGFIGSHLVEALMKIGQYVALCDPRPRHCVAADEWIKDHGDKITAVFHMGAISDTTCEDIRALDETNVELPRRIARFCQQRRIPFIYASSAAVYGNGDGPLNLYARSKLIHDEWMSDKMDFPWYGCRFFNVYGPGEAHKGRQASMIHQMYEAMNDGDRPKLFALDAKRSWVHVDDVVKVMLWMWQKRPRYGLYDIGPEWSWSFEHVFFVLEQTLGISHGYDEIEMPESLVGKYQFLTYARNDLKRAGYEPMLLSLRSGIEKFVASREDCRRQTAARPPRAQPERSGS